MNLGSGGETGTQPWLFTWTEFSGSLGDLGTFLPLVLAMSLVCHLDLGMVLDLRRPNERVVGMGVPTTHSRSAYEGDSGGGYCRRDAIRAKSPPPA